MKNRIQLGLRIVEALAVILMCHRLNGQTTAGGLIGTYNFNDGNDVGWMRYQPLAPFGAMDSYSFPVHSAPFGGAYRIEAGLSPDPVTLGFGRAGSFPMDSFRIAPSLSFYVLGWDNTINQSFGGLVNVSSLGRGTTDGYAFTYSTAGMLSISRIDNDRFTTLTSSALTLDPSVEYRFIFDAAFGGFSGFVFDGRTSALVAGIGASDSTYSPGTSGLYVFSNVPDGRGDATFDQFELGNSVPEPSTACLLVVAAGLLLCWRQMNHAREIKHRKQSGAHVL